MGSWLDNITGWLTANPQWLGLAVFIIACVECLAIAGIIVPGTVLLFAIAVLAGSGALPLGETLLLGFFGGLLGDGLSYALGRRFHQNIRRLPGLRQHPEWMGAAESYFQRYGIASLLVGRFIGPLRPMLPMIAGMCDMPLPRFIGVSLLAAAGWSVVYLLPGWATGAAFRLPLPDGFWPQTAVVATGLAALIGLCIHCNLKRHPRSTTLISAMSLALLVGLFFGYPHLKAFDQGLMALVQEHRDSSFDFIAVIVTRLGDFQSQFTVAVVLTTLLLLARQWRQALFFSGTLAITALGNSATKQLFARIRPEILSDPITSYSMPSGHSSGSFAFFLMLAVLAARDQPPRMRMTWLLLGCLPAFAVALSRVYLGVHWPTDILAGALLAIGVLAASLTLSRRYMPLTALSPRTWWLILPAAVALYGFHALWHVQHQMLRYAY